MLYYPKKSTKNPLYEGLLNQLRDWNIQEIETFEQVSSMLAGKDVQVVLDALFGFSFKPPIRDPFNDVIGHLSENHGRIAPVVSIDIPSGWDVDEGPTDIDIKATVLVSLTAPKPCAHHFVKNGGTHYLGGRFVSPGIARKYDIEDLVRLYQKDHLFVKL